MDVAELKRLNLLQDQAEKIKELDMALGVHFPQDGDVEIMLFIPDGAGTKDAGEQIGQPVLMRAGGVRRLLDRIRDEMLEQLRAAGVSA